MIQVELILTLNNKTWALTSRNKSKIQAMGMKSKKYEGKTRRDDQK